MVLQQALACSVSEASMSASATCLFWRMPIQLHRQQGVSGDQHCAGNMWPSQTAELCSMPKRLFHFKNVHSTVEIQTQKPPGDSQNAFLH